MDVRFHATLRQYVGGRHVVVPWSEGMTVWGFIRHVIKAYPGLDGQLLDADGALFRHVHVMINGRDAPYLAQGLDTLLRDQDRIDVFPPVGGGAA